MINIKNEKKVWNFWARISILPTSSISFLSFLCAISAVRCRFYYQTQISSGSSFVSCVFWYRFISTRIFGLTVIRVFRSSFLFCLDAPSMLSALILLLVLFNPWIFFFRPFRSKVLRHSSRWLWVFFCYLAFPFYWRFPSWNCTYRRWEILFYDKVQH